MSVNANYVIVAARLVEMVEAGQTSPDSVVWYLRLLLECYKRTRSTACPPLDIRNRDLQAVWNVDARAVSYRLSTLHNNGLIRHEQVGRYTWRIVLLIKHEPPAGTGTNDEPKPLGAGPAPAVTRAAEPSHYEAQTARPARHLPGSAFPDSRPVRARTFPAAKLRKVRLQRKPVSCGDDSLEPEPRDPLAGLESQPRNPLAGLEPEPRNPLTGPAVATSGSSKLETREIRKPFAPLQPREQTACLHINEEEEEDVNNSKKVQVLIVPVDKSVERSVDKVAGQPVRKIAQPDPELDAYIKRFEGQLSQKRMNWLARYGVVAAVQLELEIQAAIRLGRIKHTDINIGVIHYEYDRICDMLRRSGQLRDAPAVLVSSLRRMLRTGMIPQNTRPLPAWAEKLTGSQADQAHLPKNQTPA